MAKYDSKLEWKEIDPGTLPKAAQNAYATYKADAKQARESKERFEDMLRAAVDAPAGKKLVFAHNFGKLSAALADDNDKPKAGKSAGSLADFFATADRAGARR